MKGYPFACLKDVGRAILHNLKDKSSVTLRLWTDHCEYILAQRFRRGQQISSFYYNIWGEHALKELLRGFRRQFQRHIKGVLLSSAGLYAFDWDSQRNKCDDAMKAYFNEIDFVEHLKIETLICSRCSKRKILGEKYDGIDYCNCPSEYGCKDTRIVKGWEPYIERTNMIIWRKQESPSLFSYKVYAKYDDISATDFLHVQTDIEYRKEWDDTAVSLKIVDTDPLDKATSHIIYWEMKWPKLFANRDYVYYRKHLIDENLKFIVIYNKSTAHPECPINPNKQRVDDYWSYMVIKPFRSLEEPGLEFVLTYFDDPGLALPSTITSWVAQKQMPEFLYKLYMATKRYAEHKRLYRSKPNLWDALHKSVEYPTGPQKGNTGYQSSKTTEGTKDSDAKQHEDSNATEENIEAAEDPGKRTWWTYLYPNYYFI